VVAACRDRDRVGEALTTTGVDERITVPFPN